MLGLLWDGVPSDATKNFSRLSCRSLSKVFSTNLWLGMLGLSAVVLTYIHHSGCQYHDLSTQSRICLPGNTICTLLTGREHHYARTIMRVTSSIRVAWDISRFECVQGSSFLPNRYLMPGQARSRSDTSAEVETSSAASANNKNKVDGGGGMSLIFSRRGGGIESSGM